MARVPQVELRCIGWSSAVAELLGPVADIDPFYGAEALEQDARAERIKILGALVKGKLIGALTLRVDHTARGPELVITNAAVRARGPSLIPYVMPHIELIAEKAGCVSMRIHSARPGMARALWRHGFNPIETVYRRALENGRRLVQ